MNINKTEITDLMKSVRDKYFPELQDVSFDIVFDQSFEGVMGRALSGKFPKVVLHYSDERILEPRYRMGLVPLVGHELAHFINPVDPEKVMRARLPASMMTLWENLLAEEYARCSFSTH
ncbi:MAG: hypothetical protein Q8M94_01565 [Ignavibacteria bacterium]|nr:hypothetical protein [Ignavibacteria bacterium]